MKLKAMIALSMVASLGACGYGLGKKKDSKDADQPVMNPAPQPQTQPQTQTPADQDPIGVFGELDGEPGILWEANGKTCRAVETTQGTRYGFCKGLDVTFPVLAAENEAATVELLFTCDSLSPIALQVVEGAEDVDFSLAPRDQPTVLSIQASPNEARLLHLTLDTLASNVFKPGCKVELLRNEAAP